MTIPRLPQKPCGRCGRLVPIGTRACAACRAARGRTTDRARRGQRHLHGGGNNPAWRALRDTVLARDPICTLCGLAPSTVAEHRIPKRLGGPDSTANLRGTCKPCADRKTAREDGGFGRVAAAMPSDVQPSGVPLTLVSGPPGAGKTAWVTARAAPGDVVIDLDAIRARLSGLPWYHAGPEWLVPALAERNRLLRQLARRRTGRAWFIVGAPRARQRRAWAARLGASAIVVLAVRVDTCLARLAADPRRPDPARFRDPVLAWWREYTPWSGDTEVIAVA